MTGKQLAVLALFSFFFVLVMLEWQRQAEFRCMTTLYAAALTVEVMPSEVVNEVEGACRYPIND